MRSFLFFILCSFHFCVIGQNKLNESKPLKEVLIRLEEKYQVKFSFSDEIIHQKRVRVKENNQNISEVIKRLQEQSGLRFKVISKNRYAIIFPTEEIIVCGHVFSKATNEILPGTSIIIKHKNNGVSSNINGFFKITDVSPKDILQISSIGFKSIEKNASDFLFKECQSLFLEEDVTTLNEVIIQNYLTNSITKTIDGAIVFKAKSESVLPGLTDSDVLLSVQQLPGILNIDETASGLHIRGGSPDQNLILFNQIKLFNTSHFFGAISALNPQTIDKVKVYKTASNAKYGNHIAGVIDIESETKTHKKTTGSVGANFTHFDANVNIPASSKLSVSLAGRHSLSKLLNTPTYNKLSQKAFQYTIISDNNQLAKKLNGTTNTDFNYFDYTTKINYQPTKNDNISFSQIKIKNNLNHTFSSEEIGEKRKDILQINNTGYSLQWSKNWNKNTAHKVYTSYSDYELKIRDDKFKLSDNDRYAFIHKDNKVRNLDFGISVNHKLNKKSSINLGYQYAYNDVSFFLARENTLLNKEESFTEEDTNNSHTLIAEYLLKKNKNYAVNLGVRSNYFSLLDKFTFEPRLFAQIKVLPQFWLNSSFDIKQQNISKITETFTKSFGLENDSWVLSNNKRIPLLESNQITVGALYKYNNWIIDVDFYRRKIKGLTSITSGFETFRGFYTGEGSSLGLDVLVKKNWSFFNTWISYQTGKTSFRFNGFNKDNKFDGNFDISHSFYWANNFNYKQFNFSLGWTYRVGIPFTSAFISDFYFIGRDKANEKRLPNYHKLDFSSTYNFFINKQKNIKAQLGLSILNVYNKENILRRNYDVINFDDPKGGTLIQEDTKSLGFTPNLSFRVRF